MYLKAIFKTEQAANAFKSATGEQNLENIHIGLINMLATNPDIDILETSGDAVNFYVQKPDGSFQIELLPDPLSLLRSGVKIEPADVRIKMLASESWSLSQETWGQVRMANRYRPIQWPIPQAEITPQRPVEIFVVDCGINKNHNELVNAQIDDFFKLSQFDDYFDDLNHGTAIASLIVGQTLGVNPNVRIKNVKITGKNYKPTLLELGQVFDKILFYHKTNPGVFRIINLSWGIPRSLVLETKLQNLYANGIFIVAAAGNTAINIDDVTPAGFANSYTVAAAKEDDTELVGVYGLTKQIDLYAPGKNIQVAAYNDDHGYLTLTGSSLSAAFVSALAAQHASIGADMPSPSTLSSGLTYDSTPMVIQLGGGKSASLAHKLDNGISAYTKNIYLGSFTQSKLKQEGISFNLKRFLSSWVSDLAYTYNIEWENNLSSLIFSDTAIVNKDGLVIKLADNQEVSNLDRVYKVVFRVTKVSDGIKQTTPSIMFFVQADELVSTHDLDQYVPQLGDADSYINIDFNLFNKEEQLN
jgi:hypothetical protein